MYRRYNSRHTPQTLNILTVVVLFVYVIILYILVKAQETINIGLTRKNIYREGINKQKMTHESLRVAAEFSLTLDILLATALDYSNFFDFS